MGKITIKFTDFGRCLVCSHNPCTCPKEFWFGKTAKDAAGLIKYDYGVIHEGKYGDGFEPERLATPEEIKSYKEAL